MAHPNLTDSVDSERLAEEHAALRRVATLVARGASPAEVCETVAAEVARLLGSDFSLVGRYEADGTLTHVASHPLELLSQLGPRTVLDGDDLASIVQRSGKSTSINYDDAPGPVAALARELGVRCAVGAPIVVDDQVWGVMAAGWALPGKASSEAAERTAQFTELVATALANTESRNEITRLAEEQAALRRVATLAARELAPVEVLVAVAEETARALETEAVGMLRFEHDDSATLVAQSRAALGSATAGYPFHARGRERRRLGASNRTGRPHGRLGERNRFGCRHGACARCELRRRHSYRRRRAPLGHHDRCHEPERASAARHRDADRRVHRARRDCDCQCRIARGARPAGGRAGCAAASGDAGRAGRTAQRDLLGCKRGSRSGVRLGCGCLEVRPRLGGRIRRRRELRNSDRDTVGVPGRNDFGGGLQNWALGPSGGGRLVVRRRTAWGGVQTARHRLDCRESHRRRESSVGRDDRLISI